MADKNSKVSDGGGKAPRNKGGAKLAVNKSLGTHWVNCEKCNRWEMYENTSIAANIGNFDAEKIEKMDFTCVFCIKNEEITTLRNENRTLTIKLNELETIMHEELVKIKERLDLGDPELAKIKAFEAFEKNYNTSLIEVNARVDKLQDSTVNSGGTLDEVSSEIQNLKKCFEQSPNKKDTAATNDDNEDTKLVNIKQLVKKAVSQESRNHDDEENRRNNIIIYKVPESKSANRDARTIEDNKFVSELITAGLKLSSSDIKIAKMFRLGKHNSDSITGKPRPLLVRFKSMEGKQTIMTNVKKLKNAERKFNEISIAHDLTPQQRESLKETLREEKEKLRDDNTTEGQENFRIRVVGPPGRLRIFRKKITNTQ